MIRHAAAATALFALSTPAMAQDGLLNPVFQDHAVIQHGAPVAVWGETEPGEIVRLTLAGEQAEAQADGEGRWRAELPAMAAGGPHVLTVAAGGAERTVSDLMAGDVFLCSGQSNMVLEILRALDAPAEIASANDPMIRSITLPLTASGEPQASIPEGARWQVVGPDNAAGVSAACYFMARELRKTRDVPMGLVISAWGGTRISAWMRPEALAEAGVDPEALEMLTLHGEDPAAAMTGWGARWENWWLGETGDDPEAAPWSDGLDLTGWGVVPEFTYWEEWGDPALASHDGMVWYRTEVELTADQAASDAELRLGRVDEVDHTWLNGAPVGGTSGPGTLRAYDIAPGRLRAGRNTITVNALDTWRNGGMVGPDDERALVFADGSRADLDGQWRYLKVEAGFPHPPRSPWEDTGGFGRIANAMIAPLEGLSFRGAAWYQGESDTGLSQGYRARMDGLMADWRARFGADLPFVIVQLADFGPRPASPSESGWAEVREAQRLAALEDDRAALAVAIDLGDVYDIHPPNKQELGRRMARAMRAAAYGEVVAPSGPRPVSAARSGDAVTVRFEDVEGALRALGGQGVLGAELCGAEACRYAEARAEGDALILSGASDGDARVRLWWADSPIANLADEAGLPPPPFEITIGE